MGRKKNWDRIKNQDPSDSVAYRDVYEDQQLERSKIEDLKSPTSRMIVTVVISTLVFLLTYTMLSIGSYFRANMHNSNTWLNPFGIGSNNNSQVINTDSGGGNGNSNSNNGGGDGGDTIDASQYDNSTTIVRGGKEYSPCDSALYAGFVWDIPSQSYYWLGDDDYHPSEPTMEDINNMKRQAEEIYGCGIVRKWSAVDSGSFATIVYADDGSNFIANVGVNYEYGISDYFRPTFNKVFWSFIPALLVFGLLYTVMMRNLQAQNALRDTADINQYPNDQHIALPEEIQRKFDWFPDAGAHSSVSVSSMISHMALSNKGLDKVQVAKRAKDDILDEDGEVIIYKGEILRDENGNALMETKSLIDEEFSEALFDASGAPNTKEVRKRYDVTKIEYNPDGKNRDKIGKYNTVADMINSDWYIPEYETLRPSGSYLVDTAPVNTMVRSQHRAYGDMCVSIV